MEKSCELCNARKVKCDRMKPSCGWCQQNNRNCTYTERKKPGLNSAEIEGRINDIEARLQALACRIDNHISNDHEDGKLVLSAKGSPQTCDSIIHGRSFNLPESAALSTQLPLDMMKESPFDYSPTSSVLLSTMDLSESDLPPYHLLCDLVGLFFKHVLTWAPILDHEAISTILSGSYSGLHEEEYVLLHAIVATTLRFSKDPALTPELQCWYHKISKQKVQIFALENSSIKALQALALVAVDVLGTSDGPEGRKLLALLVRGIIRLDLDIEKNVFLEASPSSSSTYLGYDEVFALPQPQYWVEEGRRRLVWLVHMLDPNFASDEVSIDTPLPCQYDIFRGNYSPEMRWPRGLDSMEISPIIVGHPESFTYYCDVLRILSRIYRFLLEPVDIMSPLDVYGWKKTFRKLDGELNTWLSSLPGEYCSISQLYHAGPATRVSDWIMIHATFFLSVIRLYSSTAYPITQSHIFLSSQNAIERCLAATESLKKITQFAVETGRLNLLGFPFAFALWTSARLLLVHTATVQCDIDPSIWFLIGALEQMGQYWAVACQYAKILKHVVCQGQRNELENFPGQGANYAAMRQRAFDLSIVTSPRRQTVLEPPSTQTMSVDDFEKFYTFEFFHYPRLATREEESSLANTIGVLPTYADSTDSGWQQNT